MIAVDLETQSLAPIAEVGAWAYSKHESTVPLCICGKDIDTGEEKRVDLRLGVSEDDLSWFNSHKYMLAHNYTFEQAIFKNKLEKYGFNSDIVWVDSMDICAALGVPLTLEKAAEFLFHDDDAIRKDKEGKKSMYKICTPYKGKLKAYTDEDFNTLVDYCMMDTDVSYNIYKEGIKHITQEEGKVMLETHEMNYRGIPIDRKLIHKLMEVYEEAKSEIDIEKLGLSKSDLNRNTWMPSFLQAMFFWDVPNMRADTVESLLDSDIPDNMRDILEARQIMGASSIKKLYKAIATSDGEHVIRNCFQYHGAGPGRFAGRGVQPQNMPRGFKKDEDIYNALEQLGL